jgi:hypothetical protein
MRRQPVASSLPSLMMPCPACAGRMSYRGRRPLSAELEDTVYACGNCGSELVRTTVRPSGGGKPASAA